MWGFKGSVYVEGSWYSLPVAHQVPYDDILVCITVYYIYSGGGRGGVGGGRQDGNVSVDIECRLEVKPICRRKTGWECECGHRVQTRGQTNMSEEDRMGM